MSQRPTNDELHGAAIMARVATDVSDEPSVTLRERAWLGLFVSCCILGELDKQLVPVPPRLAGMLQGLAALPLEAVGQDMLSEARELIASVLRKSNDGTEPWKEGGA